MEFGNLLIKSGKVKLTQRGRISFMNIPSRQSQTSLLRAMPELFKEFKVSKSDQLKFYSLNELQRSAWVGELWDYLSKKLSPSDFRPPQESDPYHNYDWNSIIGIKDPRGRGGIVVNIETGKIMTMSHEIFEKYAPKEIKDRDKCKFAFIEFNPYSLEKFSRNDNGEVTYNQYVAPEWRTYIPQLAEVASLTCPGLIQEFLNHFYPDERERDYALAWMKNSIVSKNGIFLQHTGPKGTGKNFLVENIIQPLVGPDYFTPVKQNFFSSTFNGDILNRRIIHVDEAKWGRDEYPILKLYNNEIQNIELKGKDPFRVKNYCSYIISNNSPSDCYIEWDDRRFSILTITSTPLAEVWSREKISQAQKELQKLEIQRQWGNWLLYKFSPKYPFNPEQPLYTQKFYDIARNSLREWEKKIIERLEERDSLEIPISSFQKSMDGKRLGKDKIKNFVETYRLDGKYDLGQVKMRNGEYCIIPSDHFKPKLQEVKSSDEGDII